MIKYIITIEVDDKVSTSIKFLKFLANTKEQLSNFSLYRNRTLISIKSTIKIINNMSKYYITFGQQHMHRHNGITLDKDCIGVIKADSEADARTLAFNWFGGNWFTIKTQEEFKDSLKYYPRGFIELN